MNPSPVSFILLPIATGLSGVTKISAVSVIAFVFTSTSSSPALTVTLPAVADYSSAMSTENCFASTVPSTFISPLGSNNIFPLNISMFPAKVF